MKYYHGTNKDYDNFNIDLAMIYKDFGRGMYLAKEKWHAESIALGKNGTHAYIRVYDIDFTKLRTVLNIKEFKKASTPWIKYVIENRNKIVNPQFDVVIGATADAAAQKEIESFYRKYRHKDASRKDYRDLMSRLDVYKYPTQVALLTQKAIDYAEQNYIETICIKGADNGT